MKQWYRLSAPSNRLLKILNGYLSRLDSPQSKKKSAEWDNTIMDIETMLRQIINAQSITPEVRGIFNYYLQTIHFKLTPSLKLVPSIEFKSSSPEYLWGLVVFLLQDITRFPGRLKRCKHYWQHSRGGNNKKRRCSYFFWDQSKNKAGKLCSDRKCNQDWKREKVAKWRLIPPEERKRRKKDKHKVT